MNDKTMNDTSIVRKVKKISREYREKWDYEYIFSELEYEMSGNEISINLKNVISKAPLTEEGLKDMRGFNFNRLTEQTVCKVLEKKFGNINNLSCYLIDRMNPELRNKEEELIKTTSCNEYFKAFKIYLGNISNVDFSYSIASKSTRLYGDLTNCIFKYCDSSILFMGKLTDCLFEYFILRGGSLGSCVYNRNCTFERIIKRDVIDLSFENYAKYEYCTFKEICFTISIVIGTIFKNCKFDCIFKNFEYVPFMPRNINIMGINTAISLKFEDIDSLFFKASPKKIIPRFIDCDMSKVQAIDLKIDSDSVFENCTLSDSMKASIIKAVPFYLTKRFSWVWICFPVVVLCILFIVHLYL